MEILMELFLFFIIYAFLGWILEVVFHIFTMGKIINRGVLNGPLCPIYGFGAVILLVFLSFFNSSPFTIFLAGAVMASILEYITGYVLEKLFDTKWWDYSDMRYNINGYISLGFSILWGIASLILEYILHPIVLNILDKIPENIIRIGLPIIFIILVIDTILTIMSLIEFKKILNTMNIAKKQFDIKLELAGEMVNKVIDGARYEREQKKVQRDDLIEKMLEEALEERTEKEGLKFRRQHIGYFRSYPNLASREWARKIKNSIKDRL